MSRNVPLDHEFNKEKFAELLKKAQGSRQQNTFAGDIGMSKTYLNSYLGAKNDRPLTPSTIKKIAAASENGVSYEDLLEAAGYNSSKYTFVMQSEKEISNRVDAENDRIEARNSAITGTITKALAVKGYKWSGKNIEDYQFDFAITLYDMPVEVWYFIYIGKTVPIPLRQNSTQLQSYGLQLLKMLKAGEKISFVTDNEEDYKQLQKQELPASMIHASSILIDIDSLTVRKENFIRTACEYSNMIPRLI